MLHIFFSEDFLHCSFVAMFGFLSCLYFSPDFKGFLVPVAAVDAATGGGVPASTAEDHLLERGPILTKRLSLEEGILPAVEPVRSFFYVLFRFVPFCSRLHVTYTFLSFPVCVCVFFLFLVFD